jgi:hypothetical protein
MARMTVAQLRAAVERGRKAKRTPPETLRGADLRYQQWQVAYQRMMAKRYR